MKYGDNFTSVMEPESCMVCGLPAKDFHLCESHQDRETWGERFIYEFSRRERMEVAGPVAYRAGVTTARALEHYVPHVSDFSEQVEMLMTSVRNLCRADTNEGQGHCPVCQSGSWNEAGEGPLGAVLTEPLCLAHRVDVALMEVSFLEDQALGRQRGQTFGDGLAAWRAKQSAERIAALANGSRNLGVEEIVRRKMAAAT